MPTFRKMASLDAPTNDDRHPTTTYQVDANDQDIVENTAVERSDLPTGWVWSTFEELADIIGGVTKGRNFTGKKTVRLPYLRVANVQRGHIDLGEIKDIEVMKDEVEKYLLHDHDLVLTEGGDWDKLGRSAIWRGQVPDCIHQNHIFRARPYLEELPTEWLMYYTNSEQGQAYFRKAAKQTTNLASINLTQLKGCPIPLPPLAEQHRIVEAIEQQLTRLDAGVAVLRDAQARLRRYKAAVLKAACEGRLVPQDPADEPADALLRRILNERRAKWEAEQEAKMRAQGRMLLDDGWRAKYVEPQGPDTIGLPELPQGWMWVNFDVVSEVQGGIQKQPKRQPQHNHYPYLRVANVLRGRLDLSDIQRMELFGDELEKLRLKKDDLLIVEGNGSQDEIGRCALWTGEIENCIHQNHIIRVRLNKIMSKYASYYLNSPTGIATMMSIASSTSGLHTLSVSKVKAVSFPLPPLAEQQRIVAEVERRLSVVAEVEAAVAANLKRAERLRQSILKRAFEGKLVPQNPSDEPASALLERVRAERETGRQGDKQTRRRGAKQLRMEGM